MQQQQQQQHHLQQQHRRQQQQQCSLTSYTIYIYLSLLSCCLPASVSLSLFLFTLENIQGFCEIIATFIILPTHSAEFVDMRKMLPRQLSFEFVSAAAFNSIYVTAPHTHTHTHAHTYTYIYRYVYIYSLALGFVYSFVPVLATHLQWVNKCLTWPLPKGAGHAGRGHCLRKDFMHRHPGCLSMEAGKVFAAVACIKIDCKSLELHFISIIDFNADFIL